LKVKKTSGPDCHIYWP